MPDAPVPAKEEYEFKPAVKRIAAGLLVVAIAALEISAYRVGVSHGYEKGQDSPSPKAQALSDEKAVLNLSHCLKHLSGDDASLERLAAHRRGELAWIKDAALLREVKWMLCDALIRRGLLSSARPLADEIFGEEGLNPDAAWTHRLESAAAAEAKQGDPARALSLYTRARENYARLGLVHDELRCLNSEAELAAADGDPQTLVSTLKKIYGRAGSLGEPGLGLQTSALVHLGRVFRAQGDADGANKYFGLAVRAWQGKRPLPEPASARICLGEALLELGRRAEAEELLESGVNACSAAGAEGSYLLSGLRSLARLASEKKQFDDALPLLYRAEGIARARLGEDSPYWPCLYDQRGWALLNKGMPEQALADFQKAAAFTGEPAALAQALEGAGRASIELGRPDDAAAALEQAAALRSRHFEKDLASKARVNRTLGLALDMKGDTNGSIAAYRAALGELRLCGDTAPPELKAALLLSLGYAYSENKQWKQALSCWEEVLPLLDEDRRQEILDQIHGCRRETAKATSIPESSDN